MNIPSGIMIDLIAFIISTTIIIAYYIFIRHKSLSNPTYTIHGVNALARELWVESIMHNSTKDVLAVQTLRNFIMGSSFMASTAAVLIMGTLSLSGQAENISRSWHSFALSVMGSASPELWKFKVILLLIDFLVAFFAFAMSVRLSNHVVFMVNVPDHDAHHNFLPKAVARRLHRAGNMFAIGMRTFFFAVPLVFWFFGPYFLVIASIGLVIMLRKLDRSDCGIDAEDEEPKTSFIGKTEQVWQEI
jgi:uncharacterized membrane protein